VDTVSLPQSLKLEDPSFVSTLEKMYTKNWQDTKMTFLREEIDIYKLLKVCL
jgi:hypothetical protein